MLNLEKQKELFKNHVATLTDYGNIKILDFKAPDTCFYRIRFMFEEDYCRLHISGDLGELIASNYNNMTYEGFSNYVNNINYFKEKINCHSRPIYVYDYEKALEELRQRAADEGDWLENSDRYDYETNDEARLESIIDDILDDFSTSTGISGDGCEALEEINPDAWEFVSDIGKEETGILDLYMLAFKLAKEQIDSQNSQVDDKPQEITLKLPCRTGDHIYIAEKYGNYVQDATIVGISEADDIDCFCYKVYMDPDTYEIIELEEYSKSWFLTEKEAEEKLKENK